MNIKLPCTYPPELPFGTAEFIRNSTGFPAFKSAVLLGPSLPDVFKTQLLSEKYCATMYTECNQVGFHLINNPNGIPLIAFSCFKEDTESEIEASSIALHVFKWLDVKSVLIVDSVNMYSKIDDTFIRLDDHINMTGFNPLKYWMMAEEPSLFFLDTKDLYHKEGLDGLPGGIHLGISEKTDREIITKAKGHALTFGRSFVIEALIASYLGLDVYAIGVNDSVMITDLESNIEKLVGFMKKR
jgi:hypothetical protein